MAIELQDTQAPIVAPLGELEAWRALPSAVANYVSLPGLASELMAEARSEKATGVAVTPRKRKISCVRATPRKPKKGAVRVAEAEETSPVGGDQPLRPKSAFFCYLDASRGSIAESVGSRSPPLIAKRASELWKALTPEERSPFEVQASDLKTAYTSAMEAFLARGGTPKKKKRKGKAGAVEREPDFQVIGGDGQPSRPKSAFFCYLEQMRGQIAAELGSQAGAAVSRRAGEVWKGLSAEDKAPFDALAAELKASFDKSMLVFLEEGGVRKKRVRIDREIVQLTPSKPDEQGEGDDATLSKAKRARSRVVERVKLQVQVPFVEVGGPLEQGEAITTRRDRRGSVQVYDACVGCHVGELTEDVASLLVPLLEKNHTIRIRGHVLATGEGATAGLVLGAPRELSSAVRELASSLEKTGCVVMSIVGALEEEAEAPAGTPNEEAPEEEAGNAEEEAGKPVEEAGKPVEVAA